MPHRKARRSLTRRLNWRLILVQLLLQWCFIQGFWMLAFLWDLPLLKIFQHLSQEEAVQNMGVYDFTGERLHYSLLVLHTLPHLAALLALRLSLLLFRKKHWYWLNALIPFLTIVLLQYFNLTLREIVSGIALAVYRMFNDSVLQFLLIGSLLLFTGLVLLYSKGIHRFIATGRMRK